MSNDFSVIQEHLLGSKKVDSGYWVAIPDQLFYFENKSLRQICESIIFRCNDVLADFPIDVFLLNSHSNYVQNKSLDKEVHRSRVVLENLLSQNSSAEVNNFLLFKN